MGTAFIAWIIFNEAMPPQKLFAFAIILIGLTMVKNGTARTGSAFAIILIGLTMVKNGTARTGSE